MQLNETIAEGPRQHFAASIQTRWVLGGKKGKSAKKIVKILRRSSSFPSSTTIQK